MCSRVPEEPASRTTPHLPRKQIRRVSKTSLRVEAMIQGLYISCPSGRFDGHLRRDEVVDKADAIVGSLQWMSFLSGGAVLVVVAGGSGAKAVVGCSGFNVRSVTSPGSCETFKGRYGLPRTGKR